MAQQLEQSKQTIRASRPSEIKISDIVVGERTDKKVPISLGSWTTASGSAVSTSGSKSIVVQTPYLEVWGSIKPTPNPNIHQIITLFKGDSKKKINQWVKFLENYETHVINKVTKQGSDWFTEKGVCIKTMIQQKDDDKDTFFTKWVIDSNRNIVVDEYGQPYSLSQINDKDCIKLIIEMSDLWINNNQFGTFVIVQKIRVRPFQEKVENEYIFDESKSDSSEEQTDNIIALLATDQKAVAKSKDKPLGEKLENKTVGQPAGAPTFAHQPNDQRPAPKPKEKPIESTANLKNLAPPKINPTKQPVKEMINQLPIEFVPAPKSSLNNALLKHFSRQRPKKYHDIPASIAQIDDQDEVAVPSVPAKKPLPKAKPARPNPSPNPPPKQSSKQINLNIEEMIDNSTESDSSYDDFAESQLLDE